MKVPNINIPILSLPDTPLIATAQDLVPIADIVEDVVLYKDGGAALIMESSSLNFGLLSEREQQSVIAAYAALLNSLSFPIQIVVRSQRKDISSYLAYLEDAKSRIQNQKLVDIMLDYQTFIGETVKKKNVLGKKFYLLIPFSSLELGVAKSFMSVAKRAGPLPYPKSYTVKKAKVALYPKRDHLVRQAGRLGLQLKQLSTTELVELFYDVFNPKMPPPRPKEV